MDDQERLHELNLQVQQLQAEKEKLMQGLLLVLRQTDPIQKNPFQITPWAREYCVELYRSIAGKYQPLEKWEHD